MTDLDVRRVTESDVQLLVPEHDEPDPEVSIVIPALNEELTIDDFVAWCHQGLADAGVRGEVLIVDSSSDATSELALAGGARVLRTPKRGLGRAYIDALPHIRGRYVVMGDADCTYDFRHLRDFVERFHDGYEFVMGSSRGPRPDAPGLDLRRVQAGRRSSDLRVRRHRVDGQGLAHVHAAMPSALGSDEE